MSIKISRWVEAEFFTPETDDTLLVCLLLVLISILPVIIDYWKPVPSWDNAWQMVRTWKSIWEEHKHTVVYDQSVPLVQSSQADWKWNQTKCSVLQCHIVEANHLCVCALHLWHLVCLSVSIFFTMPLLEGSPLSMTHWLPLPESCLTLFASRSRMCHEPLCASFPWMPQSAKEDDRPSEANETISALIVK